ncbi:peptidylprolyl isomerase [Nakamurella lactea]|uniref:peptidylprolyl isomerase n=1 Tax=Nakamurella lactea TaxID=459515 RepID=UPI000415096E|nr:peptidylprolyl isomerase [Nakamurella lactea]
MPSNQQRREAAKRKLQRQLARREQERTRRRRNTLIAGAVAVVLVAAGVVWLVTANKNSTTTAAPDANATASDATGTDSTATSTAPATPCTYPASGTAAKKVDPPSNISPAKTGKVDATIALNGESVPVTLDRSLAPCSVNSFLSLAAQGFYDNTNCHRLTKSAELNILQCGDPSGKGNGGPGYEYATQVADQAKYPVGTLAMANTGTTGEGSQFFIVYGKTTIAPSYTIIGTVSDAGMKVVQSIAEKGVKDDRQDGAPNAAAKIESVKVPAEAVVASTAWPSSSADSGAAPTDELPADTGAADTGAADTGAAPTSESAPVSKTTTN